MVAEASTVKLELLWAVDRGWEDGGLQSRRTADEMDSSQSEWSYVTVVRVRVRLLGLQGTHRPHSPLAKLHRARRWTLRLPQRNAPTPQMRPATVIPDALRPGLES